MKKIHHCNDNCKFSDLSKRGTAGTSATCLGGQDFGGGGQLAL